MNVQQLIESSPALNKLMTAPMPPRTAFRLGRLMIDVNAALECYELARQSLIQEYQAAGHVEDGKISPSKIDEFLLRMQPLLSEEVGINVPSISVDDIGSSPTLTPAEMSKLTWLIVDGAQLAR